MKRREAVQIRQRFMNAVQAIPKNSNKIYDALLLFEQWKPGVQYAANTKLRYGMNLYTVVSEHTSQADWKPDIVPSLYTMIPNPYESGTADNPITYSGNTVLYQGKYYTQDNVIYYCFRDTENPVFNPLEELVGLYVEGVN